MRLVTLSLDPETEVKVTLFARCRPLLLCFVLGLVQVACERAPNPSILVVAIDSLPFHQSLCTRDEMMPQSGFATLCKEALRFTHATSPSTLSAPALTSVLTGLYPFQHGVRHNGSPGLSPVFRTFAESAVKGGMRTSLFSGGAPIWRRTGLHQGFEIFEDAFVPSPYKMFRSFEKTLGLFQNWLLHDVGADPFASVLYLPDLNFTDTVTESEAGERRSLSYDSQLEELDETLMELITFLKKQNRWDSTNVVVMGLNGREISPRLGEIEPVLLNNENTQVALLIKPVRRPRDEAIYWTVDRNVSLVDVGRTLLDLAGAPPPGMADVDAPSVSLTGVFRSPQPNWPENRLIPMESGWSAWHGFGEIRSAALTGHDLLIYDRRPVLYNTLTDRLETNPATFRDASDHRILDRAQILESLGFRPWDRPSLATRILFQIPSLRWLSPTAGPELLRDLSQIAFGNQASPRAFRWAAQIALEQKDWATLLKLGKKAQEPLWIAVAERNLAGKNPNLPDACLSLLDRKDPNSFELRACSDELFLSLLDWVRADISGDNREGARRKFLRNWETASLDLRVLKTNAALGLLWLPVSAEETLPSRTSLALALPQLKKFAP